MSKNENLIIKKEDFMKKSLDEMRSLCIKNVKDLGFEEDNIKDDLYIIDQLETEQEKKEEYIFLYNQYSEKKIIDSEEEKILEDYRTDNTEPEAIKKESKAKIVENKSDYYESEYSTPIVNKNVSNVTFGSEIEGVQIGNARCLATSDNIIAEIRNCPNKNGKYSISVESIIELLFKDPFASINLGMPSRAVLLANTIKNANNILCIEGFTEEHKKKVIDKLLTNHSIKLNDYWGDTSNGTETKS